MFKVLITTSISNPFGCHASSMVIEFYSKSDAEDSVFIAKENTDSVRGVIVSAVILNPDAR